MERIMKAEALRDCSMTSDMVSKKTIGGQSISLYHDGLAEQASADKSDKTVKDLIWLLFDTSLLTSGFNLDDTTKFARRIQGMIKIRALMTMKVWVTTFFRWRRWRVW